MNKTVRNIIFTCIGFGLVYLMFGSSYIDKSEVEKYTTTQIDEKVQNVDKESKEKLATQLDASLIALFTSVNNRQALDSLKLTPEAINNVTKFENVVLYGLDPADKKCIEAFGSYDNINQRVAAEKIFNSVIFRLADNKKEYEKLQYCYGVMHMVKKNLEARGYHSYDILKDDISMNKCDYTCQNKELNITYYNFRVVLENHR